MGVAHAKKILDREVYSSGLGGISGAKIAERQRSTFSRVYAYSVASIIFFHIAVNVSMTIGLFPIVGIPLPLVSYGGSSLLTFTVLIFILLRLDADRQMVLR